MLESYTGAAILLLIAAGIAVGMVVATTLLGPKREFADKMEPFECGESQLVSPYQRFSVKFYLVAVLFILFDIEVIFLMPWVLVFREFLAANLPILMPIFFFLFVLVLGLFYELKKGAIEWEQ